MERHYIQVCDVEKYYGHGQTAAKAVDRVSFHPAVHERVPDLFRGDLRGIPARRPDQKLSAIDRKPAAGANRPRGLYKSGAAAFIKTPASFTVHFSFRTVSGVTWRHLGSMDWKSASMSEMQSVPYI